MSEPEIPPLASSKEHPFSVVATALFGGGVCLLAVIVGLILIGLSDPESGVGQDSITALATIGGSLAGGFGGWMARGAFGSKPTDSESK